MVNEGLQEFATKHVNILVARIAGKGDKKVSHPIMQDLAPQVIQPRTFRPKSCGFTLPSTDRSKVKRVIPKNSFRRKKNRGFIIHQPLLPITSPFSHGLNMARFQRVFWMAFGWVSMYFASFCTCEKSPHQGDMAFHEILVDWWWDKLIMAY